MDEGGLPTCTRLDTFYFFKPPGDVHDGPEDKNHGNDNTEYERMDN